MRRTVSTQGAARGPAPRPNMMIRTPDGETLSTTAQSDTPPTPHLLYVARPPRCPHSVDLVLLTERTGFPVEIYDIDNHPPPKWLPGTPTLVTAHGSIYCGDAAFAYVRQQATLRSKRSHKDSTKTLSRARTTDQGRGNRAPPGVPPMEEAPSTLGCGLEEAMEESERMAKVADNSQGANQTDVNKLLDTMMNSRKT